VQPLHDRWVQASTEQLILCIWEMPGTTVLSLLLLVRVASAHVVSDLVPYIWSPTVH
jgi:hypothetical protein